MEKVIFDSNFIRNTEAKYFLGNRSELEKFTKVVEIILPSIVIEEIKQQKRRNITSKKQSFLENPFHWLKNLNRDETNNFDIDAHIDSLEKKEKINYQVIKLTDNSALERIKELALAYKPPFAKLNKDDKKNTDKGFKDAYIYLTILEYLQSIPDKNVFVCTSDDRLKEALEKEANIIVIKDYNDFENYTISKYQTDYFIEKLQSELQQSNIFKGSIVGYWVNINENDVLLIEASDEKYAVEIDSGEIVASEKVGTYAEKISNLLHSGAFATTHSAIEALNPYAHFLSDDEIVRILEATIDNSQISAIIRDEDVKQFISTLYEKKNEMLNLELKAGIKESLELKNND
ncbi:MAG: DUF4935 domain-containing protein [Nitrospinae bacterium]|nr:DUF4935 domain-containing protein [Nitrospinota bacterium]